MKALILSVCPPTSGASEGQQSRRPTVDADNSLEIAPGRSKSPPVRFQILENDDPDDLPVKTLDVVLLEVSGAASLNPPLPREGRVILRIEIADSRVRAYVGENDGNPLVLRDVPEGGSRSFDVRLNRDASRDVVFSAEVTESRAGTANVDSSETISQGDTRASFSLTHTDDDVYRGDRSSFEVELEASPEGVVTYEGGGGIPLRVIASCDGRRSSASSS